jgi:hypothetical protein
MLLSSGALADIIMGSVVAGLALAFVGRWVIPAIRRFKFYWKRKKIRPIHKPDDYVGVQLKKDLIPGTEVIQRFHGNLPPQRYNSDFTPLLLHIRVLIRRYTYIPELRKVGGHQCKCRF